MAKKELQGFDKLARHLDGYYGEMWYEYARAEARAMLDALGEEDWGHLERTWQTRTTDWQVLLADAVRGSQQPGEFALLTRMLHSDDVAVAVAAADTLLVEAEDGRWRPDASLLPVLERLRTHAEARHAVEDLMQRVAA